MTTTLEMFWFLDIIRFLVAGSGVLFTSLELHDVMADKRALIRSGRNGSTLLVANNNISNEWLRLLVQVCLLGSAIVAVGWPADIHNPQVVPMSVHRILMILGTIFLTTKSWKDRHVRAALKEYWHREGERKRRAGDVRT